MMRRNDIRRARPSLALVSPLTFWLCIGYSGLNFALGYVIYTVKDLSNLAVYHIFSQHFLSGIFALMGTLLLASLVFNTWKYTRLVLGIGLFIKSLYAYSLIDLGLRTGFEQINGVLAIWLTIVWVQFCLIVFFAPPQLSGRKSDDPGQ